MKPIYVVAALTVVVVAVTLMLLGPGKRREGGPAMQPIAEPVAAAAAVSKPSTNSLRPFFEAAEASDVVRCLQAGADPNARDEDGETPLHWAKTGEVVAMLLQAGADLDAREKYGMTPLHTAAKKPTG